MTEVRASIFSLVAECAIAKCPLTLGEIVVYAVAQHHVSEADALSALEDLVSLGLVEILPDGVILTALSGRLTK